MSRNHCSSTPGAYRLIRDTRTEMLLVTGPGHGAAAVHANLWLEGSHAERDPRLSRDLSGLTHLVRRFSVPGGAAGNPSPDVPGSIHEGGEVGCALTTAVGAALDAPERVVACIIGDGEAETAATAAAWQSASFLDPVTSGAVLPLFEVNHHKIGSPSVFGALGDDELRSYFAGSGWDVRILDVEAEEDPDAALAGLLDGAYGDIREIQARSRAGSRPPRPRWPLIIARTPKGWGTVARAGGRPVEGTFHLHHLPIEHPADDEEQLRLLEKWLRSYDPAALFDEADPPKT